MNMDNDQQNTKPSHEARASVTKTGNPTPVSAVIAEILKTGSTPLSHTEYVYQLVSTVRLTLTDRSQTVTIPQLVTIIKDKGFDTSIDSTVILSESTTVEYK